MKKKHIKNNINELYCSQEVSNLLKEKGCTCWDKDDYLERIKMSIAIEWILINFGYWITVDYKISGKIYLTITRTKYYIHTTYPDNNNYDTRKEAMEAGILYVLKSIIIKQGELFYELM